jgi:ABC-2 type transport system ATP-binding protein
MVELHNIRFGYNRKRPLFTGLNLQLNSGSIYGLLGKNGAGKTSLLKHISGLLYPKEGEALLFGYKARERDPRALEDVYIIPEEFELPAASIGRYVRTNAPFYPKFSREQLDHYLAEFELGHNEKLNEMSHGQKKKFLIAFGLATNTRLLILDEPTNGLDIPSKSQFRKIMASVLEEDKLIIISTHQVRDLENLIDVVLVLDKGQIIFNHSIADISEKLRFVQDIGGIAPDEVLYQEETGARTAGIAKNTREVESRVDLEILFNGLVKNSAAINAPFTKQTDYVH